LRESFSPLDNQCSRWAARRFLARLRKKNTSSANARAAPITTATITPGPEPLPPEGFAPPPDPSPPPPPEPSLELVTPSPEWGTLVTCVLTPEIVVKDTLPRPLEPPEGLPKSEFREFGPESCTGPFWPPPLDWDGGDPPVEDGLEAFDKLGCGESGLGVGEDESGETLGFWFEALPLPLPGDTVPSPPFPFPFPLPGVGVGCGGFCCGGGVTPRSLFTGTGVFCGPPVNASMRGMEGSEMGKSGSPLRLLEPPEFELELPFEECFSRRNGAPCMFEVPTREGGGSKIEVKDRKKKTVCNSSEGER